MAPAPLPPFVLGTLPTMTHPPVFSCTIAVVNPTPPVHPGTVDGRWANTPTWPFGCTSTIVVPVPWLLDLLLKLSTSTSPAVTEPTVWVTGQMA